MKDKHLHVPYDSELLKVIYQSVAQEIKADHVAFIAVITFKFVFYASFTFGLYYLLYKMENPLIFSCCFIAYGLMSLLFAFNFSHDFSHNTIFKSKKLNNVCFTLIYTLVGAHAAAWKLRHINSHHYAPNVADYDSDLKISNIIRVIPESGYCWFHKYQHLYAPLAYTTYSLFWVFVKDFVILLEKDEYTLRKGFRYHLSFWSQKITYVGILVLLPICFSMQPWYIVLAGFLMMHLCQSLFLLFTFFMTHHVEGLDYPTTDESGYINCSWLMNQVKSSNDMHPFSETANFILGGFNNHIAHHLFPHYHHIYYPKISRILYQLLEEHGVMPNQTSYLGGIQSHLRLLKRMGRQ
jgi:linoleoyl-CoA desaturase